MMQRRRKNSSHVDHHDGPASTPPSADRRPYSPMPSGGIHVGRQSHDKLDVVTWIVLLVFFLLLLAELYAFSALNTSAVHSNDTLQNVHDGRQHNSVQRDTLSSNSAQHETIRLDAKNHNYTTPHDIPSAQVTTYTFQPTGKRRGDRLKGAIKTEKKYVDFWKTHLPDPVPPLPPDVDPETGEKLPPIVAYVTTLTRCTPKHKGPFDGAAVLLHSIRRNSYGWVPIEDQIPKEELDAREEKDVWPRYGGRGGRYRYRAYVIVDPQASPLSGGRSQQCAQYLEKLGYIVLHRPSLVPLFKVDDPDNESDNLFYREFKNSGYVGVQRPKDGPTARQLDENPDKLRLYMYDDGCCGYKELLKLHVYGMVEHQLAVHLDFDSLLLRPMDDLFDVMLGGTSGSNDSPPLPLARGPRTKNVDFSKQIDAAFTRDYNSVKDPKPDAPVGYQGGFLVIRPSLDVLERFRTILLRGEFLLNPRLGWGGKVGGFYGDVTFQGILPYYYENVAPEGEHNEMELDRCIYNQMADNPRKSTHKFPRATPLDPEKMGFQDTNQCRDGRDDCSDTDCQRVHPQDSVSTHFTFCHKPWDCSDGLPGTVAADTCLGLLREWYGVRRELEDWWLLSSTVTESGAKVRGELNNQQSFYWQERTKSSVEQQRNGGLNRTQYLGYCDVVGEDGYLLMVPPDGPKPKS